MVTAGQRRRVSAAAVVVAILAVVFIACSVALAVNSVRAEQRSAARSNFLLTSESEAANLVFSQREVGNVVVTSYAYLAGLASRRDVQVARALLARRLSVTSESGPNPAATDEALRQALASFDAAFGQVPAGTLPADQRDAWAAALSPSLTGLDFRGKQLVTQYQQTAAQRSRDLAVAQAQQERRQTVLAIATIVAGLALVVAISLLLYRRIRRTRRTLDVEAATLAEARAALNRAEQLQEDQSRMLESIAKGAAVASVLPLAARLASLVTPDAHATISCGEFSVSEPHTVSPRSDGSRWWREFDDLCGANPSHRGILEIRTESELSPAAREEAEAVADLLSIAVERDRDARALINQARHDSLTGLPNRTSLLERLGVVLTVQRGGGRRLSDPPTVGVLFIDLDRFKVVNDSMGHNAGDQLLVGVAERLVACVRAEDELFRLSGDEFVVVSPTGRDGAQIQALAGRLLLDLEEPFDVQGTPISVGASIGIAVADESSTPASLLHEADLAMYRAKQSGRNRWQLFDQALASEATDRLRLSTELRGAVERGELALMYQPIVDMSDLHVVGYEALLRWNRPDHGQLGPDSFVALAEESRDILGIGRWVVAEATATLAAWRADGLDPTVTMAVNVAAQQLVDVSFVDDALAFITYSGVPADLIVLELTEHTLINAESANVSLQRAREAGLSIALDDFGTGYSSLTQLEGLPVDVVKVDREFVARLAGDDRRHEGFLTALVDLLAALDLRIIVEGVETQEERAALLRAGFRLGQGFLFGRPAERPLPETGAAPHR